MHLTCKNGNIDEFNRWFRVCKQQEKPFVIVSRRGKYAKVEWDCISIPNRLDDRISARSEPIKKEVGSVFDSHANPVSCYYYTAFVGSLDNLYPEDAELAAERIYEILNCRLAA